MKVCSKRSRHPLKCFSFMLLISIFLSVLSFSAIAQTVSPDSSTIQNPSHSYDVPGASGVVLTVSNDSDSASIDKIMTVASGEVSGKAYWASPTGTASWAAALSATPLAGTACCSLATANANVAAGDTVYLRAGTYNTHICPASSGTSASRISYRAYTGEMPIIRNTTLGGGYYYYHGIALVDGKITSPLMA